MRTPRPPLDAGFTIIELFAVMIIALILMGSSLVLFNQIFRGQEVRTGGRIVEQAIARARALAAGRKRTHFVRFYNDRSPKKQHGVIEIYEDTDRNGSLNPKTDRLVPQGTLALPRYTYFIEKPDKLFPDWISINAMAYARFNPGYRGVPRTRFDSNFNQKAPKLMGDVCLEVENKPHRLCIDIDTTSGKSRRQEYRFME